MGGRRASRNIALVLIGTAALAGCGKEPPKMARDHYASLDDCTADWGRPDRCDRVQSSGYPLGGYVFRGPAYALSARDSARNEAFSQAQRQGAAGVADPARQGRSIGTALEPTARGGFGTRSRSFSSGS